MVHVRAVPCTTTGATTKSQPSHAALVPKKGRTISHDTPINVYKAQRTHMRTARTKLKRESTTYSSMYDVVLILQTRKDDRISTHLKGEKFKPVVTEVGFSMSHTVYRYLAGRQLPTTRRLTLQHILKSNEETEGPK